MRALLAGVLLAAATPPSGAAGSAADLSPVSAALAPYLHVNGAVSSRYLWQPSLKREAIEYLYYVGVRAMLLKRDDYGLAVQSEFDTFDKHKSIKGFAATGAGTVAAEPIFNFNVLALDGYATAAGHKVAAQAGVLPVELPTFQLPMRCVQVADYAGLRGEFEASPDLKFSGIAGNLNSNRIQDEDHQLRGMTQRYNYLNDWVDDKNALGATRAGLYAFDGKFKGFAKGATSLFIQQETPLLGGKLIPRLYARYFTDYDLFTDVVASVEARFFDQKLWVKPGYIYENRNPLAVPLPNSNFFTPGLDHNLLFLYLESPLPRASDSVYAALTTGAKRFMSQQGTRFETGIFLRFARIPGLP